MKNPIIASITCLLLASAAQAQTSLENEIAWDKQQEAQAQEYILAKISVTKAISAGEEALTSLRSNLRFIQRVETDKGFRECIVIEDNIVRLKKLGTEAKKMQIEGKISKTDYRNYLQELADEKQGLTQKLKSKQCTTGGTK